MTITCEILDWLSINILPKPSPYFARAASFLSSKYAKYIWLDEINIYFCMYSKSL